MRYNVGMNIGDLKKQLWAAADKLRELARTLVTQVRRDATVDWRSRRNVQAKLRVMVKRTLGRYGYPPDQQRLAIDRVMEQAERCGDDWSQERLAKAHTESIYGGADGASLM